MTKTQWNNLRIGSDVVMIYTEWDQNFGTPIPKRITKKGKVIKMNSNRSQALIDFGYETWKGRLGIEHPDAVVRVSR